MSPVWVNAGGVIINAGGIVVCDTDPCVDDCYADLIAAIRERQGVLGRTVWAADAEKTLAQCITEVNAIAAGTDSGGASLYPFIAGTYSGGSSAPTYRTSSYATGAADFCALYDLVCALRTNKLGAASIVYYAGDFWKGQASVLPSDGWDYCKSQARANWAAVSGSSQCFARSLLSYTGSPLKYGARLDLQRIRWRVTPPTSTVARSAVLYGMFSVYSYSYDDLGHHSTSENHYGELDSTAAGAWSEWITDLFPTTDSRPNTWPSEPGAGEGTGLTWQVTSDKFALLTWSFAHV